MKSDEKNSRKERTRPPRCIICSKPVHDDDGQIHPVFSLIAIHEECYNLCAPLLADGTLKFTSAVVDVTTS